MLKLNVDVMNFIASCSLVSIEIQLLLKTGLDFF